MRRKLFFVALDWTRPKDPSMSLGQASILANLLKNGVEVSTQAYSVNHDDFSADKVSEEIINNAEENTDVALGSFVWNEKHVQKILNNLKKEKFPGRIILGGPQISYVKNGLEKYYPQADIFVRGYGEEAMVKLLKSSEEKPEIEGVHYAGSQDKGISANVDLESLPSPYLDGIIKPQRFIRFETQRGCPFRCSFCQHRESDVSKTRRNFALPRVMQEIDWITQNKVIQDVAVLDPTFNSGPQYLQVMDRFIEGEYSGKLALQVRPEMIKPEFMDRIVGLNKTGRVVIECGVQTIHKNEQKLIDRPNNMKALERNLREAKERGIETEVSLIFGLPGQTPESFSQSIDFCKDIGVNKIFAFPLMLLRGTPLFDMKKMLQMRESDDINLEKINRIQSDIPHVISSYSFDEKDWQKMADLAQDLDSYNAKSDSPKTSPKAVKSAVGLALNKENSARR